MMATRQGDDEERAGASPKCKKDGHDQSDLSPMSPMSPVSPVSPAPVDPLFSWPGPKTLHLQRTTQGFGFTLRHFIVYPPESAVQSSFKDEDNGSRGRPRCRLEPMDTIFVKQVKEGGSAHQAGLCTGDRIVKVNGESIIGKTYSQVIALIQNSDAALELCVMPKDEDILQLAYSKDAYLKGNEAYSGNAQNIPEPPPILYPRVEPKTSGMTHTDEPSAPSGAQGVLSQGAEASSDVGCHMEVPITQLASPPPHSQVSRLQTVACVYDEAIRMAPAEVLDSLERSPHPHRLQETKNMPLCTSSFENLSSVRPRSQTTPFSSSARGSLVQYAPKGLSDSPGFSMHIPFHPDSTSTPSSRHAISPFTPSPLTISSSPCSPMHQNIDWRNYTTYKEYIDNKRLYTYGSRTIQERLDSLRAASQEDKANASTDGTIGSQQRQRSPCHERGPANSGVQSLCSMSQERLEAKEQATSRDWHRSASQDALPLSTKSTYKPRAKSCDYLGRQAETRVMLMDRRVYGRTETEDKSPICTGEETKGCKQSLSLGKMAQTQRTMVGGCGSFPGLNATGKGTDPSSRLDSLINAASSKSQLPIQTSVLNDSYVAKALASLNTGVSTTSAASKNQRTALVPNHTSPGRRPERHRECTGSIPCLDHSRRIQIQQDGSSVATNGLAVEGLEGAEAKVVVVRREKIKKTVPLPLRHPSYIQAVNDGAGRAEKLSKTPKCWRSHDAVQDGYKQWLGEEYQLSGSGQLHESLDSIPFIDEPSSPSAELDDTQIPIPTIVSAAPPSPASSSAILHRQLSHDQDSLRFTVLDSDSGAKTERSKSYDEGLDNYRDGGRGTLMKPIGLRGLRKAVDQSSDDSGSRRNSLSDVFNTTKEGVLHFRQFSSDKGKRVGGGMRPWKQMYAVLRGHSLFLHKDKKEGQTPNSHMEEEPVSISIKACLIDISYSDTKRKNVLRLTTSNCEYLFQAEDREDMLAWIRAIQENSNLDEENALITSTDLINRKIKEYNTLMSPPSSKTEPSPRSSRQSLSIRHTLLGGNKSPSPHSPHKDQERKFIHKDEASPPKDKGLRRKGIPGLMRKTFEKKVAPGVTFGVRLDDCPPAHTNKFIPLIVEVCCKLVEERGLEYTGIYRVPGNNAAISSMQEELNKGVGEIDIQEDKWKDLNVISSLLKSFFRKLPDPLFTNEKYGDFIDANRTEDPVERLKVLKRLLHELPDHHYETLKFLSAHLKTVAENSEKNKMEPRNLAIVFGPTLVRTSEDNMTHMVTHMPDQYKIVETLIQQYDWFFTDEGEEEPETVVQTDSAVETQPVPNIDHLLTNIGRTGVSQGEVSDSPTSDSAKSKGSWGSGKDQYSLELVSSIFAAANRKRKKPKEKLAVSSSDDDLDAVFLESEPQNQKGIEQDIAGDSHYGKEPEKTFKGHKEHRNSFFLRKPSSGSVSESPKYSTLPSLRFRTALSQGSTSESSSQVEDLGALNPGTSRSRNRIRIWDTVSSSAAELPPTGPVGGSATAEVSSITSDYSTTSSMTFLTGAESSVLSADLQSRGGDEADDERSELISEGRHMETDSETEFPVFIRSATTPITPSKIVPRSADGTNVPKPLNRHVLPSQRLTTFYTSKRRSLHQKTDSESSLEVGASQEGDRMSRSEPSRLSRVLEAVKKGRSVGSLSSASSSSHSQTEPIKRLSIAERLKSHFRVSADDMFGMGGNRNSKKKEKRVRRRHTLGGQRDFGELAVINDWREQGGTEKGAELSDTERLKLQNSREISIQDWIAHERCHSGTSRAGSQGSKVMTGESSNDPASMPSCQSGTDQLNGGEQKRKGKANQNSGADAHPHKLSGAQVVRSQFYQCL